MGRAGKEIETGNEPAIGIRSHDDERLKVVSNALVKPLVITWELRSINSEEVAQITFPDGGGCYYPHKFGFGDLQRIAKDKSAYSKAKHVTFDLDRITALWLRDFSPEQLTALYRLGHVRHGDMDIKYLSGKYLSLSWGKDRLMICDLKQYFGMPQDSAMKAFGAQTLTDLAQQILVAMRDELDGIPRVLSGPSGLASVSENEHGVERYRKRDQHPEWQELVKHSYFGGRIEIVRFGQFEKVSHLDISSAYGWALSQVPAMNNSDWKVCRASNCEIGPFDLGYVDYDAPDGVFDMHPFPHRDRFGYVSFPSQSKVWLWGAELGIAHQTKGAQIGEHFHHGQWGVKTRPFAYLSDLYWRRQHVSSPMAQHLQKVALAATYGRTCQWRGWNEFDNEAPRSHQLEWAAMTTSMIRAYIWRACKKIGLERIIAVETDGIYFEGDLPKSIKPNKGFGGWRFEELHDCIFVDSGIIFARQVDGTRYQKTRGFKPGVLDASIVSEWWEAFEYSKKQSVPTKPIIRIETKRVNTLSICATLGKFDRMGEVESQVIELPLYPTGKRVHDNKCNESWIDRQHKTVTIMKDDPHSHHYPLPWHQHDYDQVMRNEQQVILSNDGAI